VLYGLFSTDLYEMIRIDSLAMDVLTTSPRIVNIYSHCGLSVHVETMNGPSIEELVMPSQREGYEEYLPPMLNATEKLKMALNMAEALADLHGYKYGPFAHFDIQIVQFLLDENLRPKMSDFNRAEPMLWDEDEKEYCKGWMGKASGTVRSPEEYAEEQPIDFNVDIYSFGNVLYTMLTGEDPYDDDREKAVNLCVRGIPPQVDARIRGRSFAEASLANVMDKCFEYFPEKRLSIFQVVSLLRDAVALNAKLEDIPVSYFPENEYYLSAYYEEEDEEEEESS
jgi:serine/threonine protein kinase